MHLHLSYLLPPFPASCPPPFFAFPSGTWSSPPSPHRRSIESCPPPTRLLSRAPQWQDQHPWNFCSYSFQCSFQSRSSSYLSPSSAPEEYPQLRDEPEFSSRCQSALYPQTPWPPASWNPKLARRTPSQQEFSSQVSSPEPPWYQQASYPNQASPQAFATKAPVCCSN